ncbi:MAG: NACHT domain-containing protein, partial [Chloroflexi bacterium]|nr:NACHT domain-containing protein [Chloroflexota bacterium]
MHCTTCQRTWPDEFRVCPICGLPLGGESADTAGPPETRPLTTGQGSVLANQIQAPVATDRSIAAGGHVVFATSGATVVIGEPPVQVPAVDRDSALGRYLRHIISRNRYLQLQGIRSGGRLVHIELEQIYVTLRASRERSTQAEEGWLTAEARLAPGESWRQLGSAEVQTETVTVSVNEALAAHPCLVVLGDPGSGKTTLLSYLAVMYARDLAEGTMLVQERLALRESGRLPVLLPLRRLGAYLQARRAKDDGTEGHALLLSHLYEMLAGERISLPQGFFERYLEDGQAVVLLDGLDEVADPELRGRVARLVEQLTAAYPLCRYVVTSRIVGYSGAAQLGQGYACTTIRDFTLADVEQFLRNWHLLVAVGQMGPGESATTYAEAQTAQLLVAIRQNERIRELAINPLMLTVIALVHRDRVKLPDRRAELYDEAVNVLLGKWQEARGVQELPILKDQPFDAGDKRLMLQAVALWMHERQQKEIEAADLRRLLGDLFYNILGEWHATSRAVSRFLCVIQERTGLLGEHGTGIYRFSHLTFQEYLAAVAVAGRDDYVQFALQRMGDPWWREVILLVAGHLSTHSRQRTTRLIQAIASQKQEPEPYHNLVLAAECLRDVGAGRVEGNLHEEVPTRLRQELHTPPPRGWLAGLQVMVQRGMTAQELARRRAAAAQALARIAGTLYWKLPYGEPEWVEIPAGEFWMGSEKGFDDERPLHRLHLDRFSISRVPITNAQYQLFVQASDHR